MQLNIKTRNAFYAKHGKSIMEFPISHDEHLQVQSAITLVAGPGNEEAMGNLGLHRWSCGLSLMSGNGDAEQWLLLDYKHEENAETLFHSLAHAYCGGGTAAGGKRKSGKKNGASTNSPADVVDVQNQPPIAG